MKSFDLYAAIAGAPVITRDGRDVRILCFDALGAQPIVGLYKDEDGGEKTFRISNDGRYSFADCPNDSVLDLFMKPVKKTYWVNVYRSIDGTCLTSSTTYMREEDAIEASSRSVSYIGTFPIEIEE